MHKQLCDKKDVYSYFSNYSQNCIVILEKVMLHKQVVFNA